MSTEPQNYFNNATFNGDIPFDGEYDQLLVHAGNISAAILRIDRAANAIGVQMTQPGITRQELIDLRKGRETLTIQRRELTNAMIDVKRQLMAIEHKYGYR